LNRCRLCVIPDTRPDTAFIDGICSACIAFKARESIDWEARRRDLEQLLERMRRTAIALGNDYDCIVPSSGGKDSHYQALMLKSMGARPLVVTATTCQLTPIGRQNIDNLALHCTTVELTPNRSVRAKLNRLGLQLVGDASWPEHVAIFTLPFRAAVQLKIPFLFYGENPQNQYGGPDEGSQAALQMTRAGARSSAASSACAPPTWWAARASRRPTCATTSCRRRRRWSASRRTSSASTSPGTRSTTRTSRAPPACAR
jgi:hypothetical protein